MPWMEIDKQRLRVRTQSEQPYHLGLQEIMQSEDQQIWEEVEALLNRKSHHVSPDYKIPPSDRVLITQLSSQYTVESIASFLDLEPSTCSKVVKETVAGVAYCDSTHIDYSHLDEHGKSMFMLFKRLEEERLSLEPILEDARVSKLTARAPYLGAMLEHQLEDGVVSPFLNKLGYTDLPILINSNFSKFSRTGDKATGALIWLRRVLYKQWLNSNSWENQFGIHVIKHLTFMSDSVYDGSFYQDTASAITLKRNLNNSFLYLSTRLGKAKSSPRLTPVSIKYFVQRVVDDRERTPMVKEIAAVLGMTDGSARKVYNVLTRTMDYLLTTRVANHDPKALYWYLRKSEVERVFNQYSETVGIISKHNSKT